MQSASIQRYFTPSQVVIDTASLNDLVKSIKDMSGFVCSTLSVVSSVKSALSQQ